MVSVRRFMATGTPGVDLGLRPIKRRLQGNRDANPRALPKASTLLFWAIVLSVDFKSKLSVLFMRTRKQLANASISE